MPRAFTDDLVVEDRGVIARKLPGAEAGGPVDIIDQVLERPILEHMHAGLAGGDRRMRLETGRIGLGARLRERQQPASALVGPLAAGGPTFVPQLLKDPTPDQNRVV